MNVTTNVIHDLLPAYVAGEASADTVALVEEFLQHDPGLARTIQVLRANPIPEVRQALQPAREKQILNATRQLLWWRGTLMGIALFLTLVPLSFGFGPEGITWTFLQKAPPVETALVCLGALACWSGFFYIRRRLQGTGL